MEQQVPCYRLSPGLVGSPSRASGFFSSVSPLLAGPSWAGLPASVNLLKNVLVNSIYFMDDLVTKAASCPHSVPSSPFLHPQQGEIRDDSSGDQGADRARGLGLEVPLWDFRIFSRLCSREP